MNLVKAFRIITTKICIVLSTSVLAQNTTTYIPPRAFIYRDTIRTELDTHFPTIPEYNYVAALIEHESCISLLHSRCWNSTSELLTSREQGLGLGQITRTFKNGRIRFDSLRTMKNTYRVELANANWGTLSSKPDLQIRIMALMLRDLYKQLYSIYDPIERLKMVDSAYNGGIVDVNKSRRVCSLRAKCNDQVWFDNVESNNVKSNRPLYGHRSARMINNHHVRDVFLVRLDKYKRLYFTNNLVLPTEG